MQSTFLSNYQHNSSKWKQDEQHQLFLKNIDLDINKHQNELLSIDGIVKLRTKTPRLSTNLRNMSYSIHSSKVKLLQSNQTDGSQTNKNQIKGRTFDNIVNPTNERRKNKKSRICLSGSGSTNNNNNFTRPININIQNININNYH